MSKYLLGFSGTGSLGGALATAAWAAGNPERVALSNRTAAKAERLAEELGCDFADNAAIARESRFIFLGVKPNMMARLLASLAPILAERGDRFILVSMAAALPTARIQEMAGGAYPVIRLNPNTPVAVGKGLIPYCAANVTDGEIDELKGEMAMAGVFDELEERLMDAATAVAGCGPAFAYMFVEALSDGGVACGLPRDKALIYAASMLAGAGEMALLSGRHPGALKDAVCSPGGSTIAGVHALERAAFRGTVQDAVIASYQRTQEMGK
jgi:pyrroline-5-carboxylate reductase